MRHILGRRGLRALHQLAGRDTLLAFDFDGTLAPIADDHSGAWMRPATRRLLARLARRYPCAVISGRALRDLRPRLQGVAVRGLVGNHGAEGNGAGRGAAGLRRTVRAWRRRLSGHRWMIGRQTIEDKGLSLTLHYRRAPDPDAAERLLRRAIRGLRGARVVPGKMGLNVIPAGAPDKGAAFVRLLRGAGCEAAVYVGDDTTDEDVFALTGMPHLLTIRVGRSRSSRAAYCLRSQDEIDDLLAALLSLRTL